MIEIKVDHFAQWVKISLNDGKGYYQTETGGMVYYYDDQGNPLSVAFPEFLFYKDSEIVLYRVTGFLAHPIDKVREALTRHSI